MKTSNCCDTVFIKTVFLSEININTFPKHVIFANNFTAILVVSEVLYHCGKLLPIIIVELVIW